MTTRIYLLRHGLTAANKNNIFAGRSREPLHPEGIAQIGAVGQGLGAKQIGRIISGPLPRTRQSAELLAAKLGVEADSAAELNEIAIPHWDGLSKEEIRQRFGSEYPDWLAAPESFQLPGCETLAEVQVRAARAVEELFVAYAGKNTLVVSHLIVLRCLVLHYRRLPLSAFRSIKIDNGMLIALTRHSGTATEVSLTEDGLTR